MKNCQDENLISGAWPTFENKICDGDYVQNPKYNAKET